MFQLLILADITMESVVKTAEGPIIIPASKHSDKQKVNISALVTGHLETLIERIEKNKPSKFEMSSPLSYQFYC